MNSSIWASRTTPTNMPTMTPMKSANGTQRNNFKARLMKAGFSNMQENFEIYDILELRNV